MKPYRADFESDMRKLVTSELEKKKVKYNDSDDVHKLFLRYYTFLEKYIFPQKRKVYLSKELQNNLDTKPERIQAAVKKLAEWAENGVDINCFQGRGLYGSGARDYQNSLYEIVHLHLSAKSTDERPVIKKNGFAKASDHLLYAKFTDDSAYFIDIVKHPEAIRDGGPIVTEWTSKHQFEILVNNWPNVEKHGMFEGMEPCDSEGNPININDETIAELVRNGIMFPISIGKNMYFPTPGIVSTGDSSMAVLRSNQICNQYKLAQKLFDENDEKICRELLSLCVKHGAKVRFPFSFHLTFFQGLNYPVVFEEKNGFAWDYHSDKWYSTKQHDC